MAGGEFLTNCKFYFEADGLTDKMVYKVSGIKSETPAAGGDKVLGSTKGGRNIRQAAPTQVKCQPITVQIYQQEGDRDLNKWYQDCNKNAGGASDWNSNRKGCSIVAYNLQGTEVARWNLENAYPTNYEAGDLEAESNENATETITLVHEGFERVT